MVPFVFSWWKMCYVTRFKKLLLLAIIVSHKLQHLRKWGKIFWSGPFYCIAAEGEKCLLARRALQNVADGNRVTVMVLM